MLNVNKFVSTLARDYIAFSTLRNYFIISDNRRSYFYFVMKKQANYWGPKRKKKTFNQNLN